MVKFTKLIHLFSQILMQWGPYIVRKPHPMAQILGIISIKLHSDILEKVVVKSQGDMALEAGSMSDGALVALLQILPENEFDGEIFVRHSFRIFEYFVYSGG